MLKIISGIYAWLLSIIFQVNLPKTNNFITPTPVIVQNQTESSPKIEIEYENNKYIIYYAQINNKQITLIPNFSEQLSSFEIIKNNNCQTAFNGGFYTKENKPLGLYKSSGKKLSDNLSGSLTVNGYFFLNQERKPEISNILDNSSDNIFQSGPYFENKNKLMIKNDEYARRIVISKSADNNLYVLTIVSKDNINSGPYLADLPPLLYSLSKPLTPVGGLNLDGGSASFFYNQGVFVFEEYTNVGSVICIR